MIDSDGHQVEFLAPLEDYLRAVGGTRYAVRNWGAFGRNPMTAEQRRDAGAGRSTWWAVPTRNTLDRATAALPKLLHERLDDMGLDFTILFTTAWAMEICRVGSSVPDQYLDPEFRRVKARALNTFRSDICREFADRMTPAAEVPMQTPEEAIAEVEHVVKELGLKVISVAAVRRPIPAIHRRYPELFPTVFRLDTFGLDSDYDYDPFWAKCVELKVPVMFHGAGVGFTTRNAPSSYVYNQMGHFAEAGEAVCKSLFLGGVTRRFPSLKVGFLECGAAWACRLYSDLVGTWQKRNRQAMENYNPAHLDRQLFQDLHARYGGKMLEGRLDQVIPQTRGLEGHADDPKDLDEWAACHIQRAEDIRDLFVPHFFFGCEAGDPMNAMPFSSKALPFRARLNALFSSDIGHWDVPDMTQVLAEAYELVERGILTKEDLRDFAFTNPVKLLAGTNPDFFKGTRIQGDVERLLTDGRARAP